MITKRFYLWIGARYVPGMRFLGPFCDWSREDDVTEFFAGVGLWSIIVGIGARS